MHSKTTYFSLPKVLFPFSRKKLHISLYAGENAPEWAFAFSYLQANRLDLILLLTAVPAAMDSSTPQGRCTRSPLKNMKESVWTQKSAGFTFKPLEAKCP